MLDRLHRAWICCEWHALSLVVVNDLYVVGMRSHTDPRAALF